MVERDKTASLTMPDKKTSIFWCANFNEGGVHRAVLPPALWTRARPESFINTTPNQLQTPERSTLTTLALTDHLTLLSQLQAVSITSAQPFHQATESNLFCDSCLAATWSFNLES
jgi:hypothetical protein